jgi:hypothetical protein
MRTIFWMTVAALALAPLGCADDGDDADDGGTGADVAAPTVAMDNVVAYQGVQGAFGVEVTAEDDVAVAQVDLLVDGAVAATSTAAPFTVTWDTTATADGIVGVAARATDASGKTAETAPVAVVVINGGVEVTFNEGATGTIAIPADYAGNTELIDQKYHWTTDADGAPRVLAIAVFTPAEGQAEWLLSLSMGTGFCPDDGVTLDSMPVYDTGSVPVVFDSTVDGGYPGAAQIFFHIGTANPMEHLGESLPFELKAFAFD